MPPRVSSARVTRRFLNRALLARQLLLRRKKLTPVQAIEHLIGLQAQNPDPPYIGLWTRLQRFGTDELSALMSDRKVVRIALMRSTIHLVSAKDCMALRQVMQPVLQPHVKMAFGSKVVGPEELRLAEFARALMHEKPRTWAELGQQLSQRWPGIRPEALARAVRSMLPLVQVPPRGLWGASGPAAHTTAEHWLGQTNAPGASIEAIIRRYLSAFGPATVNDVQAWSGLTRLREVLERMRPELLVLRDDDGRELFDMPDAPRPDADTPAPARFLPEYDNLLLAHADRSRIIADGHRAAVYSVNGIISSTVLVDGFVRATWKITAQKGRATLTITPLSRIATTDRVVIAEEGERLLRFVAAHTPVLDVKFV